MSFMQDHEHPRPLAPSLHGGLVVWAQPAGVGQPSLYSADRALQRVRQSRLVDHTGTSVLAALTPRRRSMFAHPPVLATVGDTPCGAAAVACLHGSVGSVLSGGMTRATSRTLLSAHSCDQNLRKSS